VHAAEAVLYALVEAHFEAGGHGRRSWPRSAATPADDSDAARRTMGRRCTAGGNRPQQGIRVRHRALVSKILTESLNAGGVVLTRFTDRPGNLGVRESC